MKNLIVLIGILLLVTGCAANKLLSSYHNQEGSPYSLENILVIGVAKNETKRRIYENTFTEGLTPKGVKAIPSYTVSKQSIEPTAQALRDVIAKTGVTAVLITHLVSEKEKEHYQPGSVIIYNGTTYNGLYGYYPFVYNSIYLPGSSVSTTKVVLETNLYDVQSEKLLWSARTESVDPVMTKKYYQNLIDIFLSDLQKNNFFK